MTPASLAFAVYWRDPVLVRDIAVLMRGGHIQRRAREDGDDTPAGWFRRAATSYTTSDRQGWLARQACLFVAAQLATQEPS